MYRSSDEASLQTWGEVVLLLPDLTIFFFYNIHKSSLYHPDSLLSMHCILTHSINLDGPQAIIDTKRERGHEIARVAIVAEHVWC